MRINEQGRLVVNFRTKARFRGLFVESHSGGRAGELTEPKHVAMKLRSILIPFTASLLMSFSNVLIFHGDERGSSRPDFQPDLTEERAHVQPAGPAVDLQL